MDGMGAGQARPGFLLALFAVALSFTLAAVVRARRWVQAAAQARASSSRHLRARPCGPSRCTWASCVAAPRRVHCPRASRSGGCPCLLLCRAPLRPCPSSACASLPSRAVTLCSRRPGMQSPARALAARTARREAAWARHGGCARRSTRMGQIALARKARKVRTTRHGRARDGARCACRFARAPLYCCCDVLGCAAAVMRSACTAVGSRELTVGSPPFRAPRLPSRCMGQMWRRPSWSTRPCPRVGSAGSAALAPRMARARTCGRARVVHAHVVHECAEAHDAAREAIGLATTPSRVLGHAVVARTGDPDQVRSLTVVSGAASGQPLQRAFRVVPPLLTGYRDELGFDHEEAVAVLEVASDPGKRRVRLAWCCAPPCYWPALRRRARARGGWRCGPVGGV
mmetsp:Transcript_1071/g.2929  ORF Transcript_1071/g.2929 Transcript_1071/m.2929 type:complete len:400 (+) Transcript_1071:1434-2633(+)